MAYIPQIPEKEKNQFGLQGETTPNPLPPQAGGSAGSRPSGGAAPGMASPTQFGSNAAKLSDYLKANEPQVADFGNQIASNLSEGYNKTVGNIDKGFGDFSQQVGKAYTPANDSIVQQAYSNPTEFAKNKDNVDAFKSLYNDEYSGPQNFEGSDTYANLNDQVNKATENAGLTKSFSGLSTYLNNTGKGGTTGGMNTLNTALLQRSPDASKAIQDAAKPYENLTGYLGGKTSEANNQIGQVRSTADQIRSSAQDKFVGPNGLVPQYESNLSNRLKNTISGTKSSIDTALANVRAGNPTKEDLAMFGLKQGDPDIALLQNAPKAAQSLQQDYGVSVPIGNFFTAQSPEAVYQNPRSVASQQDIEQGQALAALTGQPIETFLGQQNASPGSLINYNRGDLSNVPMQLEGKDTGTLENALKMNFGDLKTMAMTHPDMFTRDGLTRLGQQNGLSQKDLDLMLKAAERSGLMTNQPAPPPTTGGSTDPMDNVFHI